MRVKLARVFANHKLVPYRLRIRIKNKPQGKDAQGKQGDQYEFVEITLEKLT